MTRRKRSIKRGASVGAGAAVNPGIVSEEQLCRCYEGEALSHLLKSIKSFQAIILAADCNPKWLTKHIPSLASSRKVPVIFIKDKKACSLRLGELVHLKTAIAIGIKAKGNTINQLFEEIIHDSELKLGTDVV
ncbi:Ribosomal protein L7Ae/L30e/S12e/Gadd45 [Dillenia turbinata]|uniref:Ribosomal protein L7Ae/L30e/S12e/Gadd45 n=1 Tax=Dillenia turbinata TaxID=194707 RepID=A0AAN8ZKF7_9MAGN